MDDTVDDTCTTCYGKGELAKTDDDGNVIAEMIPCPNCPPTSDELARAVMLMFNTLLLLYKMDGYVSTDPRLADQPPFHVPFADNVDEAVEAFDQVRIRQELVRRIYGKE